jgi:hypothetical protein
MKATGWTIPGGGREFFSSPPRPEWLWDPPSLLSLRIKQPEHEAYHSPPSSAVVKNAWSYTSTPQYVFMAWRLVKHRDNFPIVILRYRFSMNSSSFLKKLKCCALAIQKFDSFI